MEGDEILVSTMAERDKAKAIRRDPRISLCVLDEKMAADLSASLLRRDIETTLRPRPTSWCISREGF